MTQHRDWQKDMEMFKEANKAALTWLVGKQAAEAGVYWLQEAKVYKQSYEGTLTAWEAEKARADAAEAREHNVAREISRRADEAKRFGYTGTASLLLELMASLYPDTPAPAAPKEGTPDESIN